MLILGIETAGTQVGVAIAGQEGVLASAHSGRDRRHAESLTPMIQFVANQARVELADVSAVAVDVGPGLFTGLRSLDMNIYTQIGLVMLIGLSAKSAILIVEFAKVERENGLPPREAAEKAALLRFRPILMTAFSFILGVLPLVFATGAGSNSRVSLGTAVFGGMLIATAAGVFLIPLLYYVVQATAERFGFGKAAEPIPD